LYNIGFFLFNGKKANNLHPVHEWRKHE